MNADRLRELAERWERFAADTLGPIFGAETEPADLDGIETHAAAAVYRECAAALLSALDGDGRG